MGLGKLLFTPFLFLFVCLTGWSETMAIPNAVTGEGVYSALSVTIADKIAEELVSSNLYEVLDRTYVEQILNEQEFQLSGLVSEADVKKAGEFLGADYVCVSRVTRIELFYVISAKVISVETGRIIAQTSAEEEGSTAVVFELSSRVGKQLVQSLRGDQPETEINGTVFSEESPRRETNPPREEQPEPREPRQEVQASPSVQQPVVKKPKRSHLTFSWMLPRFAGTAIDTVDENYSYPFSYDQPTNGFDIHLLLDMTNNFYFATSMGYGWQDFEGDDGYEAEDFSVLDLRLSFGMLLPVGGFSSLFFGGGLNYVIFTLGDNWDPGEGWMEEGFGISFEGGLDFYLSDLCLSARMNYTYVPELSTDEIFPEPEDLDITSIMIGAGFRF